MLNTSSSSSSVSSISHVSMSFAQSAAIGYFISYTIVFAFAATWAFTSNNQSVMVQYVSKCT
jgi:hypothetical protein